jgi:hypothetical protein
MAHGWPCSWSLTMGSGSSRAADYWVILGPVGLQRCPRCNSGSLFWAPANAHAGHGGHPLDGHGRHIALRVVPGICGRWCYGSHLPALVFRRPVRACSVVGYAAAQKGQRLAVIYRKPEAREGERQDHNHSLFSQRRVLRP